MLSPTPMIQIISALLFPSVNNTDPSWFFFSNLFKIWCQTSSPKHLHLYFFPFPHPSIYPPLTFILSLVCTRHCTIYLVGYDPGVGVQERVIPLSEPKMPTFILSVSAIKCSSSCPYSLLLRVLSNFLTDLLPYLSLV